MKICFIGLENLPVLAREYNTHVIGGEQVQHTLLAKALVRRGYTVSMVVGDYGQEDGASWEGVKTFKSFAAKAGLPVVRFIHPRWTSVWAAMKRADADVYYTSTASMGVGQAALFAKSYGKQTIHRIAHDLGCDPKTLPIKYWRDRKLYEYGLKNSGVVLSQTEWQKQALQQNYGITSKIAYMLVDMPDRVLGFTDRKIPILWVNNLRPFKRPDVMLKLADCLSDMEVHMIGGPVDGFAELYNNMRDKAKEINNLIFHGNVPYHDVNDSYQNALVFVNTSDTEGFPNSYLQAWVRGTPVVSFFDPDGLIQKEGLGFAVNTLDEMIAAIKSLKADSALWTETSQRCLAYMAREYNEDKILSPYLEELTRLSAAVNN